MAKQRAGESLVVPGHPQYEPTSREVFDAISYCTGQMMELEAERLWGGNDTACGEVVS